MLQKKSLLTVVGILAAVSVLAQPTQASAWDGWHHDRDRWDHDDRDHDRRDHDGFSLNVNVNRPYHYHHYPRYGNVVVDLPFGHISLGIGGHRYYYCDGVYYEHLARNYVVVAPPRGAHVTVLPYDYQPIVINGTTYYTSEGIYYQYTPQGYVVVPAPGTQQVTVLQSPPQVTQVAQPIQVAQSGNGPDESYTLNIPNSHGGYSAVVLKRSGDGFTGPQGEFYPDFPKVDQLKMMYGK